MQPQSFVVSDPPHGEVDHEAVADILSLDVHTTRLKMGFPAPELLAATDPEPARQLAGRLHGAGLRVATFDGSALARVPWPSLVSSFFFDDEALTVRAGGDAIVFPYDAPVIAVYWKPPGEFQSPEPDTRPDVRSGPELAERIQFQGGLDLYLPSGDGLRRATLVRDLTRFDGLGDREGSGGGGSLEVMVAELVRLFPGAVVDTRLENVRPRRKFSMGDSPFDMDMRKLYSYGTLLLRQALMSVSPELGELTQYEYGSRLGFVLHQVRDQG